MKPVTTNSIELSPIEAREMHCIYSHSLPPYNAIFYIGVCKLRDAYDFADAYRNTHWRATVRDNAPVRVTILATTLNIIEANQHFRSLFNEMRPEANVRGHVISGKSLVTCITGQNAGTVYSSQHEAAERNGITPGALSNHLNGRVGYENIRGMKFVRGGG